MNKMESLSLYPRRRKHTSSSVMCKKHPKHRQSPGVCSLCLRERLSKLSASSSSHRRVADAASSCDESSSYSSSLSSSSLYSSYASSSHSPRMNDGGRAKAPFSFLITMTKSKSMAFSSSSSSSGGCGDNKKRGLFSKWMLRSRSSSRKGSGVLMHSRTTREHAATMIH